MNKKIVGIFVMTLLISIAILPSISGSDQFGIQGSQINYKLSPGVVDQNQSITTEIDWLSAGVPHYQEFVNQGKTLEEVQLHIGCYYGGSPPLKISIEKPLGTQLLFIRVDAALYALNVQYWFTVDLPDIELDRGEKYYIVLECDPGSEYAWSGAYGDPYPQGGSSKAFNWDYAFRTIVDKSKTDSSLINFNNQFLLRFFGEYPLMFPVLRQILGLN